MTSSEKALQEHTNTSLSEENGTLNELTASIIPMRECQEVKRTKLVFLYSDEDEDVNELNQSKTQEENIESEQTSQHIKKLEGSDAHCNAKEVSTDSLLLHADLEELQEDAQHITKRACEVEGSNSDTHVTPLDNFPFYEDVALPQEFTTTTENVSHEQTLRVREVEVETLPYVTRRKYLADRNCNRDNKLGNLRTHFTIEEFANTYIDLKRPRDCVTIHSSEEKENEDKEGDHGIDHVKFEIDNESRNTVDAAPAAESNQKSNTTSTDTYHDNTDNSTSNNNSGNSDDDEDDDSDDGDVPIRCIKPIVSDDGKVHVVQSNGYCLTVNEEDLLDLNSEFHEPNNITSEVCEANIDALKEETSDNSVVNEKSVITNINGFAEINNTECSYQKEGSVELSSSLDNDKKEEEQELLSEPEMEESPMEHKEELVVVENHAVDFAEEEEVEEEEEECEEDEEESDEELDQCLLVAIVDRLVECCESPDLDSNLNIEAARFCAAAKPLLTQLRSNEITHETFEQNIHRQLHRFMRVYKNVYKPRDAPIIINGIQMDLEVSIAFRMGDKEISTTACERDATLTCSVETAQTSETCKHTTTASKDKHTSNNDVSESSSLQKKSESAETDKQNESANKPHKVAPALWKSQYKQQQEELQQQHHESSAAGNAAARESASTDWQESRLPALFGCFNTAVPPPAEPMRFHSAWDLHADDHSIANTSRFSLPVHAGGSAITPQNAISFDPVYIATVHDVESFWRLWWCVTPPSKCPIPFTYSWFRHDIKPEWEHPRNRQGGKFTIVIFDRDRPGLNDKVALDDVFTAMVLGAVGESFAECHTTLNGVMLKLRQNKPVTLQIWTSHSEMVKLRSFAHSVRDVLSKIIGSKPLQKLEYYSHLQNLASYSSTSPASRMKSKAKIASDYTF